MNLTLEELKEKIFSKYKKENWVIETLGEISREIISGNEVTKDQLGTGDYPAIRFKEIHDSQIEIKECTSFVNPDLIKNKKYTTYGDILIATTSNIQENSGKACVYLGKEKCLVGNDVKIIKHNQNPKYLSYCLSSDFSKKQFHKLSQNSTVFHLYTKDIQKIKIPLPPHEIQNAIVEFLDKFTKLEKELESRKKQYEYYKELVFNRGINELNWNIRTLGEIADEIYSGDEVSKEQLGSGNYPAIKAGDINGSLNSLFEECISFVDINLIKNKKYFECGDLLMSHFGDKNNVGTVCAYLGREKCLAGKNVYVIKHSQNPKYLSYLLSSEYCRKQIEDLCSPTIVFYLYMKDMKKIKIPLPPLEEQEKVVEALDKLYSITNDLKEGIPMLIQKNREQYNFYKELLLEK